MFQLRTILSQTKMRWLALTICVMGISLAGCERKERVIDVQTPGVDVHVDRDKDTGAIEVETKRN